MVVVVVVVVMVQEEGSGSVIEWVGSCNHLKGNI